MKKQKLRIRTWILVLFCLLSLTGVIYYSYKIITWKLHTLENKKIKDELKEDIKITP